MSPRFQLLLLAFALSGCNCFVPVEECVGIRCSRLPDGGLRDGGGRDAGLDGGRSDGGGGSDAGSCEVWDGGGVALRPPQCAGITGYVHLGKSCRGDCVTYPITTPGVYPTLSACIACGCDPSKLSAKPAQPFDTRSFCDQVIVTTTLPRLLEEAFPGADAGFDGGCVARGALDYECTLLGMGTLGDAGYARSCAATQVPYVSDVQCRVFVQ